MKQIPNGREINKTQILLLVSTNRRSNSVLHSSIAIRNDFGYCVCCKNRRLTERCDDDGT